MNDFEIISLEKHLTKDVKDSHVNGELTIIWRNWDDIIKTPQMVYLNLVDPGEIKGPHMHKKRTSYFYCIEGDMVLVIRDKSGKYHKIETNSKESKLISISNGIEAAIVNPSKLTSKILVLADISWKPNDNEMINTKFNDYDWNKLQKK